MGLPFFVVVCWVFVAGDNSGFNLEQHMTRVEALAQPEKGLFIDLIAQHEGLADELAQDEQSSSQEPVAADLEVRRPNGPWQRYNVYSSVAVAKDAMKRIEGAPIEVRVLPLYTTPPKRPWVGLTDEEIKDCMGMSIQKTCRAVEAALRSKNT